ncbi:carboxypeptidase-like regulatory domain-containing protein [Christiangramia sp. SM2212]|uniref:Carboxypeptidase-like regulatory domain-containing protein n=1 Tax=Christiangramia sediminicola TaxID=3073267 RepID=A0ABU1ERI7_9FLAO|nr:carboxypeptidase-like regulatory domain-containing protein [Christiangramia sp. SM2212]MDR5590783.1 carboxypeptidase-like regulatory domain-containing protein [Christiangramia sp. SM2212]
MKKISVLLFLSILLCSINISAQVITVRGKITNKKTEEPLPYANIIFENYGMGASTNQNGEFGFSIPDSLRNENIVVSYVGFEKEKFSISQVLRDGKIKLTPKDENLDEVRISQILEKKRYVYRPENLYESMGIGNMNAALYPSTIARYYPKPEKFEGDSFFDYIQVYFYNVREQNHLAPKFRLHIYKVQENGMPGEDILDNMVLEKSPFETNMKVELLDKKIRVPEEGFFVGLEHIFIKTNEYKEVKDYYMNDTLVAKDYENKRYAPVYRGVFTDKSDDLKVYYYEPGGWVDISAWDIKGDVSEKSYVAPVFKIRLTN